MRTDEFVKLLKFIKENGYTPSGINKEGELVFLSYPSILFETSQLLIEANNGFNSKLYPLYLESHLLNLGDDFVNKKGTGIINYLINTEDEVQDELIRVCLSNKNINLEIFKMLIAQKEVSRISALAGFIEHFPEETERRDKIAKSKSSDLMWRLFLLQAENENVPDYIFNKIAEIDDFQFQDSIISLYNDAEDISEEFFNEFISLRNYEYVDEVAAVYFKCDDITLDELRLFTSQRELKSIKLLHDYIESVGWEDTIILEDLSRQNNSKRQALLIQLLDSENDCYFYEVLAIEEYEMFEKLAKLCIKQSIREEIFYQILNEKYVERFFMYITLLEKHPEILDLWFKVIYDQKTIRGTELMIDFYSIIKSNSLPIQLSVFNAIGKEKNLHKKAGLIKILTIMPNLELKYLHALQNASPDIVVKYARIAVLFPPAFNLAANIEFFSKKRLPKDAFDFDGEFTLEFKDFEGVEIQNTHTPTEEFHIEGLLDELARADGIEDTDAVIDYLAKLLPQSDLSTSKISFDRRLKKENK